MPAVVGGARERCHRQQHDGEERIAHRERGAKSGPMPERSPHESPAQSVIAGPAGTVDPG
jgi:hypothetical protein